MNQHDDEIFKSFIDESREHLASFEEDIIALESQGEHIDDELINKVFRAVHTLKGSAGFFTLHNLKNLAHSMENLLGLIRNHEIPFTSSCAGVLLECADLLKSMIDNIDSLSRYDPSPLIQRIEDIISSRGTDTRETVKTATFESSHYDLAFSSEQLQEIQRSEKAGKFVYLISWKIVWNTAPDSALVYSTISELKQYGAFGAFFTRTSSEENFFDRTLDISILYSTVVEPSLLFEIINSEQVIIEILADKILAAQTPPTVAVASQPIINQPFTPGPSHDESVKVNETAGTQTLHKAENSSIRVNLEQLDRLMSLAGELVLARNSLLRNSSEIAEPRMSAITQHIDSITSELQEAIMSTRMQSVGILFTKYKRIVRDLARTLGKKIQLTIEGEDVELDKTIIEALNDPLTHLVRNSADHGIETPEKRIASGKNDIGTLSLKARHEAGQVIIEIIDDGAGIDPQRIRSKAIEKKMISKDDATALSDKEMIRYIFKPGFSTAEKVTDVSGRGVGLDVVLSNLTKVGGAVDIDSQVGKGSKIILKLPLTLAIIPSILVAVGNQRFAIPQLNVVELVRISAADVKKRIERIGESAVIRLRGILVPLIRLADVLQMQSLYFDPATGDELDNRRKTISDRRSQMIQTDVDETEVVVVENKRSEADRRVSRSSAVNIIIVTSGVQRFGLVIDHFLDSEEIVVKPIGSLLSGCVEYAGATILGDGSVAFILNVSGISTSAELFNMQQEIVAVEASRKGTIETNRDAQTYLIVRNSIDEQFAIPLGSISRIERFRASEITSIAGQSAIFYGETTLPLLSMEKVLDVKMRAEGKFVFAIVFKAHGRDIGIMASQIVDIIDIASTIDISTYVKPGILGSVIVEKTITLILDLHAFVNICLPDYKNVSQKILSSNKKVLIVEDSPFFLRQLKTILIESECEVLTATNGVEGIEILENNADSVGVCFTDIEMPVMDGVEMSRKIRSDSRFRRLPIIAVTTLSGDSAEKRAREAGISEYLIKMDREQIIERCRHYLNIYNKEPIV